MTTPSLPDSPRPWRALGALMVAWTWACTGSEGGSSPPTSEELPTEVSTTTPAEAGFLTVPPREVVSQGKRVRIDAEARLFFNLVPAARAPEEAPLFVFFNGFSAEVVRAFGTGPRTVAEGGAVVPNAASLTSMANLLYVDPRQAGFSYDVLPPGLGRSRDARDCSNDVFNEYVDAADVLLGVLSFLARHPRLRGPVYWVGESYAGVRIQWILAYLRGRWDLAGYEDPVLAERLAQLDRPSSLRAGQILLQPWLLGSAHSAAIEAACKSSALLAEVSTSTGAPCRENACLCADARGRSRYNHAYPIDRQKAREREGSLAHVLPERAQALLGVPLTSVPELEANQRAAGFKCSPPDDETPSDARLVELLGALPAGESYYVPHSPLQPGKELAPFTPDWRTKDSVGRAFADNLRDVPAFVTDGPLDLVVPTRALAPGLGAILGAERVQLKDTSIRVTYADGERTIPIATYPLAGHMVTMLAAEKLTADLGPWIRTTLRP